MKLSFIEQIMSMENPDIGLAKYNELRYKLDSEGNKERKPKHEEEQDARFKSQGKPENQDRK